MAVARDHLAGDGFDLKPHGFGHMRFHPWIDIGKCADGAGNGAGGDFGPRRHQPRARAHEFGIKARQLDAECGGFGMDAMAAPDGGRHLVFKGAFFYGRQQRIGVGDQKIGGAGKLHIQACVQHVG